MREMVKSQLGPGEKLGAVVSVMDQSRATLLTSVFYLAAVDSGLVLLN